MVFCKCLFIMLKRADVVKVNYLFSEDTGREGAAVIPSFSYRTTTHLTRCVLAGLILADGRCLCISVRARLCAFTAKFFYNTHQFTFFNGLC